METKQDNELLVIQQKLIAPKGQFNKFGHYNYRSCEDILKSVKPLLAETRCTLNITDDIMMLGERFYVKATATLTTSRGTTFSAVGWAREADSKSGMDVSQVTGAASSYARKYALNGLFAIDDTKDADYLNTSKAYTEPAPAQQQAQSAPQAQPVQNGMQTALAAIHAAQSVKELTAIYNSNHGLQASKDLVSALTARRKEIQAK